MSFLLLPRLLLFENSNSLLLRLDLLRKLIELQQEKLLFFLLLFSLEFFIILRWFYYWLIFETLFKLLVSVIINKKFIGWIILLLFVLSLIIFFFFFTSHSIAVNHPVRFLAGLASITPWNSVSFSCKISSPWSGWSPKEYASKRNLLHSFFWILIYRSSGYYRNWNRSEGHSWFTESDHPALIQYNPASLSVHLQISPDEPSSDLFWVTALDPS